MKASNPIAALELVADDAVSFAEQVNDTESDHESARLLMAATTFQKAVECWVVWRKSESKK